MSVLDLRTSHAALLAGEKSSLWSEIVLEGPQPAKTKKKAARPPVDLVIVVDRSGSMGTSTGISQPVYTLPIDSGPRFGPGPVWGPNINYVAPAPLMAPEPWRHQRRPVVMRQPMVMSTAFDHARMAAQQALSQLGPEDRSAVVVYDSHIDVLASLSSRHFANGAALNAVGPRGATDLAGGLFAGIDQLADADPSRQRRVFLLSDGRANNGETNPDVIASAVREFAEQGIVVSTFGLGRDYNEDLLQAIAEAGGGGYYYLESADAAPEAFREELAEIFRPSLAQVEVLVKPAEGVRVTHKYGAGTDLTRRKVKVGDIPAGAQRRVYLELTHAKKHAVAADDRPLAEITVRYKRHGETRWRELTATVAAQLTKDEQLVEGGLDHEVLAQVAAFEAAHHQAEAAKLAESGDLHGARGLMRQSRATLSNLADAGHATPLVSSSLLQAEQYDSLLAAGAFDASTSKAMKYDAYRTRSSR